MGIWMIFLAFKCPIHGYKVLVVQCSRICSDVESDHCWACCETGIEVCVCVLGALAGFGVPCYQ